MLVILANLIRIRVHTDGRLVRALKDGQIFLGHSGALAVVERQAKVVNEAGKHLIYRK